LALAERIDAKVFIIVFKMNPEMKPAPPHEEACLEMVHSAREAGVPVSFHFVRERTERELYDFVQAEHIDVVVIGARDKTMRALTRGLSPRLPVQIIRVEEKQDINSFQTR
jgi:nucleotide-binding universal stress UspA family protein